MARIRGLFLHWNVPYEVSGSKVFIAAFLFVLLAVFPFNSSHASEFADEMRRDYHRLLSVIALLSSEADKVQAIHLFFNHRIAYRADQEHFGVADRWQGLPEILASGAGDCEDYVIAKYEALRSLGISHHQLKMAQVPTQGKPHMVLLYSPDGNMQDPLVLDNRTDEVLPLSRRPLLKTNFEFDELHIYYRSRGRLINTLRPTSIIARWHERRHYQEGVVAVR